MTQPSLPTMLQHLREQGWFVAVHNDYRQGGRHHTFWLFTDQGTGRFVKGEGETDEAAVAAAIKHASLLTLRGYDGLQHRAREWVHACFGERIANDRTERNHRFLEEALELVQACGCTAADAHALVGYVFGRDAGTPHQEAGGVMIHVEATVMEGTGQLVLTGQLGEVMKESAQAALSYTRARARALGIAHTIFRDSDIHIHVPAGAIPKDGPSAGITIAVAVISALTATPVCHAVAMSGEITLRGQVLPVGGVKEKMLAARQGGVQSIVLPQGNCKDLDELRAHLRRGMRCIFASTMDEVLAVVLPELRIVSPPLPFTLPSAR